MEKRQVQKGKNHLTKRKAPLQRLADRIYRFLGFPLLALGGLFFIAWWGSEFLDYAIGSVAVYLVGSGLILIRLQDLYDARVSLMTRQSEVRKFEGLPAQLWSLFWIVSLILLTLVGVYFVFQLAIGQIPNLLWMVVILVGMAVLRMLLYYGISTNRISGSALRIPGWAELILSIGSLVVLWFAVYGLVQFIGLPF